MNTILITIPEAARILSCSERHVWRLIRNKELKVFRHGGLTRVTESSLRDFIGTKTSKGHEETPPDTPDEDLVKT